MRERHGFLHDEQGNRSSGRLYLAVFMAMDVLYVLAGLGCIVAGITGWVRLPDKDLLGALITWYGGLGTVLTAVTMANIGWVAGPRLSQYLLPQLGATIQGIGSAFKKNLEMTDERGLYTEREPLELPPASVEAPAPVDAPSRKRKA